MEYPILIVDDNKLLTGILSKLLHSLGYDVVVAHSGREAMRMLKNIKPKIIFLDIGMSVMDGYEVAKNIRNDDNFSQTILVAFTGRNKRDDKLKAREAGFDHYINKSASIAEIRMILNAYDF
ncbi:MAG: Multi-sensor hybrid histidine kinase [Candidatus Moranbacteria bacterium GW2011_GWC2_37_8]|nr:MAG: Multi-sensor hybrid histidine kinase [Candidatus Moranbacteria bacterium GW2011_GWC2_37_8]KKQ62642.1 MAG: PAS/PAC sensor hybrid histidine kinase [Parcubacteria group bacterium GW2011_GWC1_38_22]KKQ81130.1 MAG: Multi-sensor hybrid histidine kinase [Candidatus Moranbacteria bacterium GW2011_GWD2_38_7]